MMRELKNNLLVNSREMQININVFFMAKSESFQRRHKDGM